MRLIDADNFYIPKGFFNDGINVPKMFKLLKMQSTIDPESIRPHGKWEEIDGDYRCTNCHHAPIVGIDNEFRLTKFCPYCGAEMRV